MGVIHFNRVTRPVVEVRFRYWTCSTVQLSNANFIQTVLNRGRRDRPKTKPCRTVGGLGPELPRSDTHHCRALKRIQMEGGVAVG